MGVNGGGEVVVEGGFGLAANVGEHVEEEHLYVAQVVRVAGKLRVVPADVRLLERESVIVVINL